MSLPISTELLQLIDVQSTMRRLLLFAVLTAASLVMFAFAVSAPAQTATPPAAKPATLRSVLLAQLRSTHNHAEWFTPIHAAVAGLTPEQARWVPPNRAGQTDPANNHSVGMLANHLLFWNRQTLARMRGEKPAQPASNEETFNSFNAASWNKTVRDLDQVMLDIERMVETLPEADLQRRAGTLANVSTHNAYHTGQILYVRKLQGSWNPENGVK